MTGVQTCALSISLAFNCSLNRFGRSLNRCSRCPQILQAGAGGAVPQDLSSIPAEDLGAALSKLMSVDMATQAEVDSGKLQQMMKFVLGAVQTLATEQQESKLARTEIGRASRRETV